LIERKDDFLGWITVSDVTEKEDHPGRTLLGHDSDDEISEEDYDAVIYEEECASSSTSSSSLSLLAAYNDPLHGRIIPCREIICKIGDRYHSFPITSTVVSSE
jgi:hypothetical protein